MMLCDYRQNPFYLFVSLLLCQQEESTLTLPLVAQTQSSIRESISVYQVLHELL
jgi:hypothetical protein